MFGFGSFFFFVF